MAELAEEESRGQRSSKREQRRCRTERKS